VAGSVSQPGHPLVDLHTFQGLFQKFRSDPIADFEVVLDGAVAEHEFLFSLDMNKALKLINPFNPLFKRYL
jgi:hypothetical protein